MVDPQLVAERQVEVAVQPVAQQVRGQVLLAAQGHPRQAELPLLVVEVRVEERRLAHEELRHVVQPQLVEVVAADHHQHVGLGPGQGLPEALDLGHPLVGERRPVRTGRGAGPVVEGVVGGRDDRGQFSHDCLR